MLHLNMILLRYKDIELQKNTNNSWAILDAISEEINNNIFRKGHRVLGLSSAIIGSGMAFRYNYFKTLMSTVTAVGGFDKDRAKMLKEGRKIVYLDDAVVYDEKIQKSEVLEINAADGCLHNALFQKKDILTASKHLVLKVTLIILTKQSIYSTAPHITFRCCDS
jgi:hypothetical protein